MKIIAIDVGGTHVKFLLSGKKTVRKFDSGLHLTPSEMVARVTTMTKDWRFDVVSIGYPGPVVRNRAMAEPHNLGKGWVGFRFERAFGCPVRVVNDAAMQALGSFKKKKMLFLGLGTGLGSALVVNGAVEPMELAHLPYRKGTYEDYLGLCGLKRRGKKKWRKSVFDVVERLAHALQSEEVVLGGGNVKKMKMLPPQCRIGDNKNAFLGGFRLWETDKGLARIHAKQSKTRS